MTGKKAVLLRCRERDHGCESPRKGLPGRLSELRGAKAAAFPALRDTKREAPH